MNIQILNGESEDVPILIAANPATDLTKFANSLTGITSRTIRDENREIRRALDEAFWQPGYVLAITGHVRIDVHMNSQEAP